MILLMNLECSIERRRFIMGNRIEFFQSVEQNNEDYASIITSLFDQFSLLYNLVGNYESVKVTNTTSLSNAQFLITCTDEIQFKMIFNNILSKGSYTELYGRIFKVTATQKSKTSFILELSTKEPQITRV